MVCLLILLVTIQGNYAKDDIKKNCKMACN